MLVTRKRNLVWNGRSKSPLGSEMKGDISLKGRSVQRGEKIEGSSVKTIKESVWSNQSDFTHAMKDNSVQRLHRMESWAIWKSDSVCQVRSKGMVRHELMGSNRWVS